MHLVLDTWPYGGHTSNLEALMMGLPVVSRLLPGVPFGRYHASVLHSIGLPELGLSTEAHYVSLCIALATWPGLARLRLTLPRLMRASPLLDGKQHAAHAEALWHILAR